MKESANLRNESDFVSDMVYDALDELEATIYDIMQLAKNLSTGEGIITILFVKGTLWKCQGHRGCFGVNLKFITVVTDALNTFKLILLSMTLR